MSENFGNELKRLTGVSIPLGALRTEKTPVIGEYTSLPEFAEFCKDAGLSVIQLLPVLDTGTSSSPYSTLSAFALHPIYISIYKMENFTTCYEKILHSGMNTTNF
ncbi:4-alpha-glucanotransferase [Treponema zioleckii]|uniref:4-alpha-glucanotransferase n=1 Tax=Treponema zioleckii TaxID=331680 RepID=UPI00168A4C38|nr:4-alpha-glucanotransferase [Treponema zioleckii]